MLNDLKNYIKTNKNPVIASCGSAILGYMAGSNKQSIKTFFKEYGKWIATILIVATIIGLGYYLISKNNKNSVPANS